jgi:beta-lactamase superfamily II metal-dependent hydrolase
VPIELNTPNNNTVEVSIFGPGVGEALCVHLGDGKWLIVDSCLNPETKQPASLEYLKQIGVNCEADVVMIVITHWHDDHIRGMATIVKNCLSAKVAISGALLKKEFITLSSLISNEEIPSDFGSGMVEMASILSEFQQRTKSSRKQWLPITASADKRIYQTENVEIWTLSPSDEAVTQSLVNFSLEENKQKHKRRVVPTTANLNAIALWISTPQCNILLGSDLETSREETTGWQAVVNSKNKPTGKAQIVKVPHHGSETGHYSGMWDEMVDVNATGLVSSYSRSKLPLPRDIDRLKNLTGALYHTTGKLLKPPRRDKVVEQLYKSVAKNRVVLSNVLGQIQTRVIEDNSIKVELSDNAVRIK